MTILIASFSPNQILLASDTFRYYLKPSTLKDVLEHQIEITHANFKDHVEKFETNQPKIRQITKSMGLIAGGDGAFAEIIENLDKRKNVVMQILERLKQKTCDHKAFWGCHVAEFAKGKCQLTSIFYKEGAIETKQHLSDNITFDSFSPEMKDVFFKKYVMPFYISNLEEKMRILNDFFSEITKLYNGLAGGNPVIAKIDEEGFKWL